MSEFVSPEDQYAKAMEAMEKPAPAEAAENTPPDVGVSEPVATDNRARGPDGKFVPVGDKGTPDAPAKEPFAGFSSLPEEAQREFNRLTGRVKQYENDNKAMAGKIAPLQRELQSLRTRAPAQTPKQNQVQQQRTLDKWDAHAKAYPEDAEAIQQLTASLRSDLEQGVNEGLGRVLTPLEQRLAKLEGLSQKIEQQERDTAALEAQDTLSRVAGDNWKQVVGWEDEHGNPVPVEKQQLHGEFEAWIGGHDPGIQNFYREQLKHTDPGVVGEVIRRFNQDRFALEGAEPATNRRAENLRDVAPSSSGGAKPPSGWTAPKSPEDQYAEAMDALDRFHKSKR